MFTQEQLDAAVAAAVTTAVAEKSAKLQELSGKVSHYEKTYDGIDAEEARANKQALKDLEKQNAGGDPKKVEELLTKQEKELREKIFKPELEKRDGQIGKLQSELKELRVVETAFGKVTGKLYDKASDEFKAHIRATCDVDDDGNVIVKDTNGKPRYSPKNAAAKMTIDEYIEELVSAKDHWFLNQTASGTHKGGEKFSGTGAEITFEQFNALPDEKQKEILNSKDFPAARRREFFNRVALQRK